jgi:hypothetical protein
VAAEVEEAVAVLASDAVDAGVEDVALEEAVAANNAEDTLAADTDSASKRETIAESVDAHRTMIGGALMTRDVDMTVVVVKYVAYMVVVVLFSVEYSGICAGKITVETLSIVTTPEPSVLGWLKAITQCANDPEIANDL